MLPTPIVSVVIPTYNRRHQLRRVLEGLSDQRGLDGPVEVVVVSDGSTDGTVDYLNSQSTPLPVRCIEQSNAGPAAARNAGVETARGDLVLFLDDDVVPEHDLLRRHIADHAAASCDAMIVVIGPMLTPRDVQLSPWVQWEQDMLYRQYDAMKAGVFKPTARQFYTGNASMRRTLFERLGGFDPTLRRAEDVEFAYRLADAGATFVFDESATAMHYAERSFESWYGIAYEYGRNDIIFGRDRGQTWLLKEVRQKFANLILPMRIVVRACVRWRFLSQLFSASVRSLVGLLRFRWSKVPRRFSLSAIYAVAHFLGVADELGGADAFRRFMTASGDAS